MTKHLAAEQGTTGEQVIIDKSVVMGVEWDTPELGAFVERSADRHNVS